MRRVLSRRIMPDTPPVEKKDYLCVTMPLGGNIHLIGNKPNTMNYVKMSSDGRHWQDITSINLGAGGKVYIKGSGSAFGKGDGNYSWQFQIQGTAFLSGNIMSLLYDDDFEDKTIVGKNAFAHLFAADSVSKNIANISNLKLPATEVGDYAYANMFAGTSTGSYFHTYTKTPKLPATTLGIGCYRNMFAYSKVDEMPDLPATTLAAFCYQAMFKGCSIKEAKILPATVLAEGCYHTMFSGQTTDIHIPHNMLPATTLAKGCYAGMFGSSHITTIPSDLLPSTTLAVSCYASMFIDCTALTYIPDRLLPATLLADYCYQNMFTGCSSLTRIPRYLLPATTHIDETSGKEVTSLAVSCYSAMFSRCTSLVNIPIGLLSATKLASTCYNAMFQGCIGITELNSNLLPATELKDSCYQNMFGDAPKDSNHPYLNGVSITKVPKGLLHATKLDVYCYQDMFAGCPYLTDIASPIISENTPLYSNCFDGMFRDCTALVTVDKHLIPTSNLNYGCCSNMFKGCNHLTNTIEFANVVFSNCYTSMYEGCTALTDYEELPATTLAAACYKAMFKDTGIIDLTGKDLPANLTSNDESAYESMFEGCKSLTTVPADFIKTNNFDATSCCKAMFKSCSALTVAPYLNATGQNSRAGSNAFYEMFAYDGLLTHMAALSNEQKARLPFILANGGAFRQMFAYCSKLTEIPTIDVKNLFGGNAFAGMFVKCKALETIPEGLFKYPMSISYSGYNGTFTSMFQECEALWNVPSDLISNQTISGSHYESMFQSCSSLVTPPELPNGDNNYRSMFQGCTSLTSIATISDDYACYCENMYFGCTSLTTVNNLPNLTSANGKIRDYTGFFKNCTSLTSVPTIQGTDVHGKEMFYGCTSLTSVTLNFTFSTTSPDGGDGSYMFYGCSKTTNGVVTGLTTVNGSVTINAFGRASMLANMFNGCKALVTPPTFICNTTRARDRCYFYMFGNCESLTNVVAGLTNNITMLGSTCYGYMYYNCKKLNATLPNGLLPAETADTMCYYHMFDGSGITGMEDGAMALKTLASSCCSNMFNGCKNLASVYCVATNPSTSHTNEWLKGAGTDVQGEKTFTQKTGVTWPSGVSGIPEGWKVEYVSA